MYPAVSRSIHPDKKFCVRGAGINQLDGHSIVRYTITVLQNKYDLGIRGSGNSSLNSHLAEKKQSHPAGTAGSVHKQSAGGYSRYPESWTLFQSHCRPWRQHESPPPSRQTPRAGTRHCSFRTTSRRALAYRLRTQRARAPPGPFQNRRPHVSQVYQQSGSAQLHLPTLAKSLDRSEKGAGLGLGSSYPRPPGPKALRFSSGCPRLCELYE